MYTFGKTKDLPYESIPILRNPFKNRFNRDRINVNFRQVDLYAYGIPFNDFFFF